MAKKIKNEETYKRNIISKMKQVGVYNNAFMITINTFAKIMYDYETALDTFERSGGNMVIKHTNKNGSTNIVKNPLYLAIEKLRTDIMAYARELGLTPAGLRKLNQEIDDKPATALDEILSKLEI